MTKRAPANIDPDVEFGHVKATHHRFALALLWWLLFIAALLIATGIGPLDDAVRRLDDWWQGRMLASENGGLVRLGEVMAYAGSVYATVPVRFGVGAWLIRRAAWDRLGVWLGAWFFSEASLSILKAVYGRPRPPFGLEVTRSSSFPSGHSVAATATAIALVYVFARAGRSTRRWMIVAAVYAVVMALSRTYLRVHWLSDVVVGMAIGTAAALAAVWVVERWTVGVTRGLQRVFGRLARDRSG